MRRYCQFSYRVTLEPAGPVTLTQAHRQRHLTFHWRESFFSPPTIQALYLHMIKLFSGTNYNHALLKIILKKISPGFTLVKEFIARLFF